MNVTVESECGFQSGVLRVRGFACEDAHRDRCHKWTTADCDGLEAIIAGRTVGTMEIMGNAMRKTAVWRRQEGICEERVDGFLRQDPALACQTLGPEVAGARGAAEATDSSPTAVLL
jgi:hypothetical protein